LGKKERKMESLSYENLTKGLDRDHEVEEATMKAMIYAECREFFDGMAKIITGYASTGQDLKLMAFFEMMENGCNRSIEFLAERSSGSGGEDARG
jgi:hypothetical protein